MLNFHFYIFFYCAITYSEEPEEEKNVVDYVNENCIKVPQEGEKVKALYE